MSYFSGNPFGVCHRCGFQRRLHEMRREWSGSRVCIDTCFDARPADTRVPLVKPEGMPYPNASPEPDPIYRVISDNGRSAL